MSNKLDLTALSANFTNGGLTVANGVATIALTTAIPAAVVKGTFITTALATTAAVLAFVGLDNQSINGVAGVVGVATPIATSLIPNLGIQQACIVVHCVNAAGARKERLGPYVATDALGNVQGVLSFPSIPDSLTPVAYSTIRNVTNLFIWGTTLWNATGVIRNSATGLAAGDTANSFNVSTLPARALPI